MRTARTLRVLVLLGVLTGCGATPQSVCRDQCRKRASCGTTINLSLCDSACGGQVAGRTANCVNADVALQQCQVQLPCEQYSAGAGCTAEVAEASSACRP